MIIDLHKDYVFRGFTFEVLAEKLIRKLNNNYFLFRIGNFGSLDSIIDYYKLNLAKINNIDILKKYFKTFDLIEFELKDFKTKLVNSITLYEVKTRVWYRKEKFDISIKAYNRMKEMSKLGFDVKIASIIMFKNWKFSLNIYDLSSFNALRLRKDRFLFFQKEKYKSIAPK